MNTPDMREHRKLQSIKDRIEAVEDFIEFLNDGEWKVCRVHGFEVKEELTLDKRLIYSFCGINYDAIEDEKEQAVKWALNRQ